MTVLFGTVEYFEREIINYLNEHQLNGETDVYLTEIKSKLEDEVLNDFVCDEKLRIECLNNLKNATELLIICK